MIIGLAVVFVIIFEFFAKKILPLYRKPMLITLAALVLLVITASFGLNQSKAFQNLCSCNSTRLKPIAWMFKGNKDNYNRMIKSGRIKEINGQEIVVELNDGQIVSINKNRFCKECRNDLNVLDEVVLSGINGKNGFKPLRGKKYDGCFNCELENEIKSDNSCNNI
jgi:hypothetical protein